MPLIYNVTIEPIETGNRFRITWQKPETNTANSFEQESEITPEDRQRLWQWPQCQLGIGQKLFRFLDGDAHCFQQALNQANDMGEPLQVNLWACKQIADWPFELLAMEKTFLLSQQLHLVRCVSDWGKEKQALPGNRPLKLLFIACSALDVQPELDFEKEEEAIFRITENLAIDMEVEDSGSLEGLRSRLEREEYDVVYLSGHAGIDKDGSPYFIMEDEFGNRRQVSPGELWKEGLIENPPRLLFLSGCRTGETPNSDDSTDAVSFAHLLVEKHNVPAVLGWGRSVHDNQAIHAGKMLFHELSRGKTILEAVQRARYELIKDFPGENKPAWPLLRLFSSGLPLDSIVAKEQEWKPKVRIMTHVYLKNSLVKVLKEGFVGRRRQLQTGLRALKQDIDKVGLLLLGTGGLGKSCLAGKICERFPDHTLIIIHGRLNAISIESALKDAFVASQDDRGKRILAQKIEMKDKLANLCSTCFKEKNYLLLLDDFEQNLEGVDKGEPGSLLPETADLLTVLLHFLPFSGKMTQLVITSRYEFFLTEQNRDMVEDCLQKVRLTSFRESEQRKKAMELPNILKYEDQAKIPNLLAAGHGNPRLMEWLDILVGQLKAVELPKLLEAIKDKQEDFVHEHVSRELLNLGGKELEVFLRSLSGYNQPVLLQDIETMVMKLGLKDWERLLKKGIELSLVEHDQARKRYQVTPLLRDELLYHNLENFLFDTTIDNDTEKVARSLIKEANYLEARSFLEELIEKSPHRKQSLENEFGFLYDFKSSPEKDESYWNEKKEIVNYRRKLWHVLSGGNNFFSGLYDGKQQKTEEKTGKLTEENVNMENDIKNVNPSNLSSKEEEKGIKENEKDAITPEKKGEELEKAVFQLFRHLLERCEEESSKIINARQQDRGRQRGHDLKFVIGISGGRKLRILIECKNVSEKLKLDDIGGKLLAAENYHQGIPIDHWILVSPNANVSNELDELIELWDLTGKYPFKIQAWTPGTRVQEFFGLIPGIYDKIIEKPELEIHPQNWTDEYKQAILESWKQKLEPPLRLPKGWEQYLRDPGKMTLDSKEFDSNDRYKNKDYVEMNCFNETGALLPQTLEKKILDWLDEPVDKSPTIFLLGEFGDGKTFFTYILTRKLLEKFQKFPKEGWIPVRFALKNYAVDGKNNPHDFLRTRLEKLGTDIPGWEDLRREKYKLLVILDGFDEISKELDPNTIQRNIDILIEVFLSDYFSGLKMLITSRKHFFESQRDKARLIDKLHYPQLIHLAPIDRKTTENYLTNFAERIGAGEKFKKLKEFHDLIGMGSKPLFLEMAQTSMRDLPEQDLNECALYETYIQNSFKRKIPFLYDRKKDTPDKDIIGNASDVMESVAKKLHQSHQEYVYLSDIRLKEKDDLKEWLWRITDPDAQIIEDETGHIATRSLLKRVEVPNQPENKKWAVDFCHRSMREYFVAKSVCNMLKDSLEEAKEFLNGWFLNYEIIFFAGEIMKHKYKNFNFESNLMNLILRTKCTATMEEMNLKYLGGNAVNLLYRLKGYLPGNDWSNLLLDGAILPNADLSGKNFSHTSLKYANLDNVNFNGSDFSDSNLTEVRIEETTPVQSISITPLEKILALYHDGAIREWTYGRVKGQISSNLSGNIKAKGMKLIAQPSNDLIIVHDRHLNFYDRTGNELIQKADIEIKPEIKLLKATRETLLLNDESGNQSRIVLVDLDKLVVVKALTSSPFALCDHLDGHALILLNESEDIHIIDLSLTNKPDLIISTVEKVSCIASCKCGDMEGQYLLGVGLYNGSVQIWKIKVQQWNVENLLEHLVHTEKQPVKDITFMNECRVVSGGLDKTIKLLSFNHEGQVVGEVREFKMTLQCRGMKIDGVIREKVEQKKLQELLENAK